MSGRNEAITVTVLGIKGNQVRIGIPKGMTIDRGEVALRRMQEGEPVGMETHRSEAIVMRS